MGSISVACYKPKPGCEQALMALVRVHPPLRGAGFVTDRESIVMRAADGTIIEVFEWVSQEAIASAHAHLVVLELWVKFEPSARLKFPVTSRNSQHVFAFRAGLKFSALQEA